MVEVIKRDGERVPFDAQKIGHAIAKAMLETEQGVDSSVIEEVMGLIDQDLHDRHYGQEKVEVTVELIQDMVEYLLMQKRPDVAKRYIIYRDKRAQLRDKAWEMTDLQYGIWNGKYRFQNESFEEWLDRVSGGNKRIKKRIRNKEFSFGGRILAGRGLPQRGIKITYSNCYVLTPPADNIEGIFNTARDMARTYSYGGGVGISLRKLRPRNARVNNASRNTSGAVSFMDLYSLTTGLIGQEGRRGALMLSMPSNHPDLEEFIDIKLQGDKVTKANISVEISDLFMHAVVNKEMFTLRFVVEDTGEVIEKEVDAFKVFSKLAENNWRMAEPGILFWDRISNYHLMSEDPDFYFAGTNPCAEEPLPPGGSCLLGSINLSEFIVAPFTKNARFDYPRFIECVHDSIEALNDVLDEGLPLHPLEEQRISVADLRQIGLGYMGIADASIKLGQTYGSTQNLAFWETVAHLGLVESIRKSALIAKERGTFNRYNWEHINKSPFFLQNIPTDVKDIVKEYGLRNSQVLCIAPTGSISSMLGVSGGIEPIFANSYTRKTESLHKEEVTYKVYTDIVKEYMEFHGLTDEAQLPSMFVTAHTLHWKNRIEMQAVWQRYIDASISSTLNLPQDFPKEQVAEIYQYAWDMGLKGCTIYREGCERAGILVSDEAKKEEKKEEVKSEEPVVRPKGYFSKCPECGSEHMVQANGCVTCQDCGFSPC